MNGFNVQLVENTINTSLGHIAIHRRGFQKDMRLEYNFRADEALYDAIRGTRDVISFAPRVKVEGMVRSSEASRGVTVMGIDPVSEKGVSRIYQYTLSRGGAAIWTTRRRTRYSYRRPWLRSWTSCWATGW